MQAVALARSEPAPVPKHTAPEARLPEVAVAVWQAIGRRLTVGGPPGVVDRYAVAQELGRWYASLARRFAQLVAAGVLARSGPQRAPRWRLLVLPLAVPVILPPRGPVELIDPTEPKASEVAECRCLRCDKMFVSTLVGNRICKECERRWPDNSAIFDDGDTGHRVVRLPRVSLG